MSLFVVVNPERTQDRYLVFWGPGGVDYTTDLDKAGRYTEAQAEEIKRRSPSEIVVSLETLEPMAVRHVSTIAFESAGGFERK